MNENTSKNVRGGYSRTKKHLIGFIRSAWIRRSQHQRAFKKTTKRCGMLLKSIYLPLMIGYSALPTNLAMKPEGKAVPQNE